MEPIPVLQLTGNGIRFLSKIHFLPQTPKDRCQRSRSTQKFPVWRLMNIIIHPKDLLFSRLCTTSKEAIAAGMDAVTVPTDSKKRKNDLQILN